MGQLINFPIKRKESLTAEEEYDKVLTDVEDRIKYHTLELEKAADLYNLLLNNTGD